jgi:hypothetical protein
MEDIEYGGCIIRRPDGGLRIWRLYNQEARWRTIKKNRGWT